MPDANERTRLLSDSTKARESPAATDLPYRTKATILASVWLAVFLGAADTTVVATLIGPISASFNASNQLAWLGTSYLLTLAACTPLYGRLSDIYGRKFANLLSLVLFGVGTLGCGAAPTIGWLIAARAVAGMGAGGIMSTSSIIASDLVPIKQRGAIQGLANLFFGLGAGIGGPLGGYLADTVGWRTVFYIQIPVVCASLTLVSLFVNYRVPSQGGNMRQNLARIDWLGALTLAIAVVGLLLAMSYKTNEDRPVSSPSVWVSLVVFIVFLVIFLWIEARFAKEPILPSRILTSRTPFFTLWVNFLLSGACFVSLYFYPLYFQAVALNTSSQSGLHLIPNAVALSVGSLGAGLIMRKTGKYYWLLTSVLLFATSGLVAMCFLNENSTAFEKWFDIVPNGAGTGAGTTVALIALISSLDREDMAVGTAMSYLFRYCGQVVGVGVAASIMQAVLTSQLRQRITGPGAAQLIEKIRHQSTIVRSLPTDQQIAAVDSYRIALHAAFAFGAALAILGTICTIFIREYPLPGSFAEEEEARKKRSIEDP